MQSPWAAGSAGSRFGGYTVYNLTVEDDHTFFVGTTGGGTWVHNTCTVIGRVKDTAQYLGKEGYDVLTNPAPTWGENLEWLHKAFNNGQTFKLVTDPQEIETVTRLRIGGQGTMNEIAELTKLGANVIKGW